MEELSDTLLGDEAERGQDAGVLCGRGADRRTHAGDLDVAGHEEPCARNGHRGEGGEENVDVLIRTQLAETKEGEAVLR